MHILGIFFALGAGLFFGILAPTTKIAFNLGLSGAAFKDMTKFVFALYTAYDQTDSSLLSRKRCQNYECRKYA